MSALEYTVRVVQQTMPCYFVQLPLICEDSWVCIGLVYLFTRMPIILLTAWIMRDGMI
jgi:hypothetical protein